MSDVARPKKRGHRWPPAASNEEIINFFVDNPNESFSEYNVCTALGIERSRVMRIRSHLRELCLVPYARIREVVENGQTLWRLSERPAPPRREPLPPVGLNASLPVSPVFAGFDPVYPRWDVGADAPLLLSPIAHNEDDPLDEKSPVQLDALPPAPSLGDIPALPAAPFAEPLPMCKVCERRPRSVLLMDCGHLIHCDECAPDLPADCPSCGENVSYLIRGIRR